MIPIVAQAMPAPDHDQKYVTIKKMMMLMG